MLATRRPRFARLPAAALMLLLGALLVLVIYGLITKNRGARA